LLQADSVSFGYDGTPVLHAVSLNAPRGQRLGILGPNGSGKTTLLRLLAGFVRPEAGQVLLGGNAISRLPRAAVARRMALVPQETHLAFDYSVIEIALMGRYPYLAPLEFEGPQDLAIARDALRATGTDKLEDRSFTTLSGGEKQRVIIASALAQLTPAKVAVSTAVDSVLLLDEPTASLDLGYQLELVSTLRTLNQDRPITMVVSTHDLNFAASLCHELVLLRDGRVIATGPTESVLTRANIRALYDVDVDITRHAAAGHLAVVPIARIPLAAD